MTETLTRPAPAAHAAAPGPDRTHATLKYPTHYYRVNVVRRHRDQPGLVATANVAEAANLRLTHEQHGEWLTYEQARALIESHGKTPQALEFLAWLRPRLGALAPSTREVKPTRWGRQPLRGVMRERHFTVQELTARLNTPVHGLDACDLPVSNVAAAAAGSVLPRAELIERLLAHFGGHPTHYFTEEVLKAAEDRDTLRALQAKIKRLRSEQRQADADEAAAG